MSIGVQTRTSNKNSARFSLALPAAIAVPLFFARSTSTAPPFFANQTGQHCTVCHNNAPTDNSAGYDLTDVGNRFKANGFNWPLPPVCEIQQMRLYDENQVYRGIYNVKVCR